MKLLYRNMNVSFRQRLNVSVTSLTPLLSTNIGKRKLNVTRAISYYHRQYLLTPPVRCMAHNYTSHRFLTSSPVSSDAQSIWRQKAAHLLRTPIGDLDEKLWTDSHFTILWLLNNCVDHNVSSSSSSSTTASPFTVLESIHMAFELIDRLYVEEQMHYHDNNISNSITIPEFFKTELLNLSVNHWRKSIPSLYDHISSSSLVLTESDQGEHKQIPPYNPSNILERLYRYEENSSKLLPDCQTYSIIIDAISSIIQIDSEKNQKSLMNLVDQIIDRLVNDADKYDTETKLHPNVVLFSSAMNAWTKSGLSEAPERVDDLLHKMEILDNKYPEWGIKPNVFSYSTAIDAWAKVRRVDKVQRLLQKMYEQASADNDPSLKPGLRAFNGYLVSLARSGRAEEAEALLYQMEDFYDSGEFEEPPSVIAYSTVIDSFAKSNLEGASMRAESFLRRMIDRENLNPNAVSYNSVINAHVQSRNIEAAANLLQEMHDSYLNTGDMEIRPTLHSYSSVISGFAKSRLKDSGERAEHILEQIKELSQSGDLDRPPDNILYNSVLDCWAKSSSTPETATRVMMFLDKMKNDGIIVDVITYNTVINCLAKSGKVHDAERMLEEMESVGVTPNSITYNTLLAAYLSKSSPRESRQRQNKDQLNRLSRNDTTTRAKKLFDRMTNDILIEPDVITYNTMLHIYSRLGNVEKSESLLKEMLLNDSQVSPDSTSFNTVINAWANSGKIDAPRRAEAILEQMLKAASEEGERIKRINPESITFNSVMSAWTKTRSPFAAERCQNIFNRMKDNDTIQPDFVTFNIMIHAWSLSHRDDAPDQATSIFSEMNRRFEAGNSRMRPNARTYGSLINVWSKSQRPDAGQKAENYLTQIIQMYDGRPQQRYTNRSSHRKRFRQEEPPRVFEFTATIRAWLNSGDPNAPLKADRILYMLLRQVEKGNKKATPDTKLFHTILLTLSSSKIPNKDIYANRIIQMMIEYKIRPNKFLLDELKRCHEPQETRSQTK